MNLLTKQKETHRVRKRIYGYQGKGQLGTLGRVCTNCYLKWITNRNFCIAHGTLLNVVCASQEGRRSWGKMDTCICMAESLCCSPETTTTLLIDYTSIQNKKFSL